MFCPKCGAQIPDDSEFCSKCGAALKITQQAGAQPQATPQAELSGGITAGLRKQEHYIYVYVYYWPLYLEALIKSSTIISETIL